MSFSSPSSWRFALGTWGTYRAVYPEKGAYRAELRPGDPVRLTIRQTPARLLVVKIDKLQ